MIKAKTNLRPSSKRQQPDFKPGKAYQGYLTELKQRIRSAQLKAARVVNLELVSLYWEMGKSIIEQQKASKWGSGFIAALSKDLQNEFPGMGGFSETNLKRMRRFAEQYAAVSIRPQAVAQLPWGHISTLIERVKDAKERDWYAAQALEYGWSRSVLEMQMDSDLFARQGKLRKKTSNFMEKLPPEQSDLALQSLRDPYLFDFLTIGPDANEREIEKQLTTHIGKFLLELGTGFAFIGRQVPIAVGESDFQLDMLF
jgi:predicted nuclease of restriction endonuclease-like (RecB) superfamily